jgi:hypothetical protein
MLADLVTARGDLSGGPGERSKHPVGLRASPVRYPKTGHKREKALFYESFVLAPAGFELSSSGPGKSLAVLKRLIAYGFRRIAVPTVPARFRAVSTAP